jgi:DNA repair protein RecO (recombination protein O)
MLEDLGYGLDFSFDINDEYIKEDMQYEFIEHQGFNKNSNGAIPGKTLVSLSKQETITDPIQLTILKKMNRKRLKSLLGDKPLKSKELFFVK